METLRIAREEIVVVVESDGNIMVTVKNVVDVVYL